MSELFIKTTSLEDDRLDCEVVNLGTDNIEHSSIDLHTDDMEIISGYGITDALKAKTYEIKTSTLSSNTSTVITYDSASDFTTKNLAMTLFDSSDNVVMADMKIVADGSKFKVKVTFAQSIGSNTYRLVVVGL